MVFIQGSGDVVSLSGGTNTVTDTGRSNTYILPTPAMGWTCSTVPILSDGDLLDLKPALAATAWDGTAGNLAKYLTVTDTHSRKDFRVCRLAAAARRR